MPPARDLADAASEAVDGVVDRPRVVAEISRRLERHGLVQVSAHPGTGKTTAVAQLAACHEGPVAWLSLDEAHREPGTLLDALSVTLRAVLPRLARWGGRPFAGLEELKLGAADLAFAAERAGGALLVLDDAHHLHDSPDAIAVLGAFGSPRRARLPIVVVGREPVGFPGLGVESHHPDVFVGRSVLDATLEESAAILDARGRSTDPEEALATTGGWIAALVFESWRLDDARSAGADPLEVYFSSEFRPLLGDRLFELLVRASVFERLDAVRLTSLGFGDAASSLRALRRIGIPGTWSADGASLRLHPRIRELLAGELDRRPADAVRAVRLAAAQSYERELDAERAIDLYLAAGEMGEARRLLPQVIVDITERGDLGLAARLLTACAPDPTADDHPSTILASLMLASSLQQASLIRVSAEAWFEPDRLRAAVEAEPRISPYACIFVLEQRPERAERLLELTPAGRAAETTRLILSCMTRDDPDAVPPPLIGDSLDPLIARGLWFRGKLSELRKGLDAQLLLAAGIPGFLTPLATGSTNAAGLGALLDRFARAVERRDIDAAQLAIDALGARPAPLWAGLCEAEAAVRLSRDPERAGRAIARLRERPDSRFNAHRECIAVWEGGARLLEHDDEAAATILRDAVASMRRGDRRLELATALVYLAEARWRVGDEDASDEASEEALSEAHAQGSLSRLVLALADFPGVLSRRIDAEPSADGEWHALGRAIAVATTRAGRGGSGTPVAHLREFGEPALVHRGRAVRPKIRKSLELLSFLVSRPGARATRADLLTALWDGRDDASTRAYLRQALRHLRDVLPDGLDVDSHDDLLALDGTISCESGEAEAMLAKAALLPREERRGLLLELRGLLTRGLFLEGSKGVTWIDDRREAFRAVLADVQLDLADLALHAEEYVEALGLADEALAQDVLLERGWRIRMRALGMLGDLDGVLEAYRACRASLAEIGLEPSRATTDLARTLRA